MDNLNWTFIFGGLFILRDSTLLDQETSTAVFESRASHFDYTFSGIGAKV